MDFIPILRLSADAILPTRAHLDDAGLDLYCMHDIGIPAQTGQTIATGIAVALAPGHVGMVADRSSMAKKGIKTAGGVIDAGYRGEIHVVLWNISAHEIEIKRGDRIAQILILPIRTPAVREVSEVDQTERGIKGFGSSGK